MLNEQLLQTSCQRRTLFVCVMVCFMILQEQELEARAAALRAENEAIVNKIRRTRQKAKRKGEDPISN